MKKVESQNWKIHFDEIENKINSEIFDEQIWIWEKMWKIAEVTYSYDSTKKINWNNVSINFTLFSEIWWLDLENFSNLSDNEKIIQITKAKDILINKINTKQNEIFKVINNLNSLNLTKKEELYKKEIILKVLEEKLNLFNYCLIWLPFELEKAWIKQNLSKKEEENINKKLKELDKILFWGEVKENSQEVKNIYKKLIKNFEKEKDKLNKDEQKKYLSFLNKIKKYLPKDFDISEDKKPESLLKSFYKKQIEQKNYIKYFNNSLDQLKLDYKAVINNEAWSISDWPKTIEFPTKNEYKNLNLARILKLEQHEILTHTVTDYNNSKILGNIRWAKSTEKDEWLAIFMENIFEFGEKLLKEDEKSWKQIFDLDKFSIPENIFLVLMWEILNNKDLKEFLSIQKKIWFINKSENEVFLRLKRSNKNWVQHKDTSYYRWLVKVIEELNKFILTDWKEWISFYDFFIWKCSFEDIPKMIFINKSLNNWEFKKPNFAPDRTIFILKWEKNNNFIKYLEKKYPFINFWNEKIKEISKEIKENIYNIIE